MTYKDIDGWFDFEDVYRQAVQEAKPGDNFCEVGCWLGKSTVFLAQEIADSGKPISLIAVDTWLDSPNEDTEALTRQMGPDEVYRRFLDNLTKCGVRELVMPMRMTSQAASLCFRGSTFAFVFLNGPHSYEAVAGDIWHWYPTVKRGGVLAGHDYTNLYPPVVAAVDIYFKTIEVVGNSWRFRMP